MMEVTALWRHPMKAHGREALEQVTLVAGQAMPFDRMWAVAHDNAQIDGPGWQKCANFTRGASIPALMAIEAHLNEVTEQLTLHHPDLPDLTFHPDTEAAQFIDWIKPLLPSNRAQPERILRLSSRGFTDTAFPSLSLCNVASHHAIETLADTPLQQERWRGNIWFDGAVAWEEFDWIGQDIGVGQAVLRVEEPITRCMATTVNTDTGVRDVDTLATLGMLGHQEFGIYATVTKGGTVTLGDLLELI
jgi:uncharacterized protein YcbX